MIVAENPQVEAQKTPELLRPFTPLLGLQGRLIMGGDALHPHTQVDLAKGIPEDSLSTTLALMEQASIRERRLATKGVTLDAWKQDVVNKFAALPHPPSGQSPDTFFDKLGINSATFNLKDAQKLYDQYFSKGNTEQSMSLFIATVVKAFSTTDAQGTSSIDIDAIQQNLSTFEWMAGMFGKNSSELITQLQHAILERGKNPKTFVEQRKDEVNELSQHETDLLLFLTQEKPIVVVEPTVEPHKPPKPPKLTSPTRPAQAVAQSATAEHILLDPDQIKQQLETEVPVDKLPAISILARQIDRNYVDIQKKDPTATPQHIAEELTVRFDSLGLYQRIVEQHLFGPKDFERFDDPNFLAPLMPQIKAELENAEQVITMRRPTAKLMEDNGWLHLLQGNKKKTDYRIYLSPNPTAIGNVFADLACAIPENVNYQMKTFYKPDHPLDVSRIDKIIVYCSKDNFNSILNAVAKICKQHITDFTGRPNPGGGTLVPFNGVSVAKEMEKTGSEMAEKRIKERLDTRLPAITKETFLRYTSLQEASQSDEAKFLWNTLDKKTDRFARFIYFPENIAVTMDQKNIISHAYSETLYHVIMKNLVEGKHIDPSEIQSEFLNLIKTSGIPLSHAQFDHLKNDPAYTDANSIADRVFNVIRSTGFIIAFDQKLKAGRPPSEALQDILSA